MRRRIVCGLATATAVAFCFLKSYEVQPVRASWSGWAPQQGYVGQTFTANFDSITEVSLFTGSPGAGANYDLRVFDAVTAELIAHQYGRQPAGDHRWLKFDSIVPDGKFFRGKEYLVEVTRPGDSINWYKDIRDKYHYGHMVGGTGPGKPPPGSCDDLCLRIYGKARVGDEFSVQSVVAWPDSLGNPKDTSTWSALVESEADLGVRSDKLGYCFGEWINPGPGDWHWDMMDSLMVLYVRAGVGVLASVGPGSWASSSIGDRRAITRNLFEPLKVGGVINDSNPVGKYMYEFAKRYGPRGTFWRSHEPYMPVMVYEAPSEPDQGAIGRNDFDGWWQHSTGPDSNHYVTFPQYRDTIDSFIARCGDTLQGRKQSFLWAYSRYVTVMDAAIKAAARDNGAPEESLPRSACYIITMPATDPERRYGEHYWPGEWIQGLKDYGAGNSFDIASYHAYHSVEKQASLIVDTLRHYFSAQGLLSPRPFWASEAGHFSHTHDPGEYDPLWPLKLFEAYATVQYVNAIPGYPVEQWTWFTYTERYMADYCDSSSGHWVKQGITDSEFLPRPPAYAYKQWSELCRGASFEGRIPAVGPHKSAETLGVYVLQYRDSLGKRFWVAWEQLGWSSGPRTLKVPARADTESVCGVDTSGFPPAWVETAATSGWFVRQFDTLPVIIKEGQNFSRPDLAVDSFRVTPERPQVGEEVGFTAYIRNRGNRATPDTVWYRFLCDTLLADSFAGPRIDSGATGTVEMIGYAVPSWMSGQHLFRLEVNPGQKFVEKVGLDDNDGYSRNTVVQSVDDLNLPKLLTLSQPFPNPARTRLNISYALPRPTRVCVKLYDIAGKMVNTLASGDKKPGYYNLVWNRQDSRGRKVPCGVYFCTLSAESQRFSRTVVLTD
jgi:hypothetical protein